MNDIKRIKKLAGFEPTKKAFKALIVQSKIATKHLKEFGITINNLNKEASPWKN